MKKLISLLGRILFSVPFLVLGIMHLTHAKDMAGMLPSFLPVGIVLVYLTGVGIIAASISLYIQKYVKLSMMLLSLFLLSTIFFIHLPGLGNPATHMMAMVGLLKDAGLLGGALTLASMHWNDK